MKRFLLFISIGLPLFGEKCPWDKLAADFSTGQREAIASYGKAVLEFKGIYRAKKIDRKEVDSATARRVSETLSREAEKLLESLGMPYQRVGKRIQILPSKSSSLGRYAASVKRIHGARLVFPSPRALLREGYPSSYDPLTRTQELSVDALARLDPETGKVLSVGRLAPIDIHEASHITEKGYFRGSIYPHEGSKLVELGDYGSFCSIDELRAGAIEQSVNFLPLRELKSKLKTGEAISKVERRNLLDMLRREQKEGRFWNGEIPSLTRGIRGLLEEARIELHGRNAPKIEEGIREWKTKKLILVVPEEFKSISEYLEPILEIAGRQEAAYGSLRAALNRFLFLEKTRRPEDVFSEAQNSELLRAIEALEALKG